MSRNSDLFYDDDDEDEDVDDVDIPQNWEDDFDITCEENTLIAKIRCHQVLKRTRFNSDFDPGFILQMVQLIKRDVPLTEKQLKAIKNIYFKWC